MLEVGSKAPDFTLNDKDGKEINLKDFQGQWVIVYFYPKADTPGCTIQAIDFTTNIEAFSDNQATVLGISNDPEAKIGKFIDKHELKIILLSDPEHGVIEKYGAWVLKKMYGREYMGTQRSTFLINPEGKIKKVWAKVKVKGHVEEVKNLLLEPKVRIGDRMLNVGDKAPEFCLPNESKEKICLQQFEGKWIVLYFYPKDQTPGCTQEACDFTDNYKAFENLNAVVIGVSANSPESHMKFKQKRALSIILLSDVELNVIEAYKAKTTSFLGKMISPVKRVTYLIDPEGNIAKTWSKVNVIGHTVDVKNTLVELIK